MYRENISVRNNFRSQLFEYFRVIVDRVSCLLLALQARSIILAADAVILNRPIILFYREYSIIMFARLAAAYAGTDCSAQVYHCVSETVQILPSTILITIAIYTACHCMCVVSNKPRQTERNDKTPITPRR